MADFTPDDARKLYESLVDRARRDPAVAGLVLSGSQARPGMATELSDYDVYLITWQTPGSRLAAEERRGGGLDVGALPLAEYREYALPGTPSEFFQYAFVDADVVLDKTEGGRIAELTAAKAVLTPEAVRERAGNWLAGLTNSAYRWLKNHRDGRVMEARLDAADTVPGLLTCVFTLEGRVRPYNKYLRWELERRPLAAPQWSADRLLPLVDEILTHASPEAAHTMIAGLEPQARAAGLGGEFDDWGDDLRLLRGR